MTPEQVPTTTRKRVFISLSFKNRQFVDALQVMMNDLGLEAVLAEHELDIHHTVTEKIKNLILSSNLVIAALTEN